MLLSSVNQMTPAANSAVTHNPAWTGSSDWTNPGGNDYYDPWAQDPAGSSRRDQNDGYYRPDRPLEQHEKNQRIHDLTTKLQDLRYKKSQHSAKIAAIESELYQLRTQNDGMTYQLDSKRQTKLNQEMTRAGLEGEQIGLKRRWDRGEKTDAIRMRLDTILSTLWQLNDSIYALSNEISNMETTLQNNNYRIQELTAQKDSEQQQSLYYDQDITAYQQELDALRWG